jgi:dTDP-4-amino-4,6-dideoxygalactose transaminase
MSQTEIPSAAPGRGYQRYQSEIDAAIAAVLESGQYVLGAACHRFEQAFATYLGVAGVVGTASGTDALELALRSLRIGSGDEVLIPALTASATATAVVRTGAIPVLVDIDPLSYTIDPDHVSRAISGDTKAIIPVHLYGQPSTMGPLVSIARQHGLLIVEDCAQSHGARIGDLYTGSFGDIAAFSFYPTKNLPALGDGGCVASNNRALLATVRQYGWEERQISTESGMNSRLDDLQAAILEVRLSHLDQDNGRRRQLATVYANRLSGTDLTLPGDCDGTHVYHQFSVTHPSRDKLRARLSAAGVGTGLLYPRPLHEQPAFETCRRVPDDLPVATRISREVLCLPIYPELLDEEADRVIAATLDLL